MFTNNKTNAILKAARLDERRVRASFKKRRDEIATARRAKVQAALKKEEELKAKKLQQLEQYTNDIIDFGLWQSEQAVDDELASSTLDSMASKVKPLKFVSMFCIRMLDPLWQGSKCSRCRRLSPLEHVSRRHGRNWLLM